MKLLKFMYNLRFEAFLIKLLHYLVSLATSLGIKAILAFKVCLSTLHFKQEVYTSNKDYRGDRSLQWLASPHLYSYQAFFEPVNVPRRFQSRQNVQCEEYGRFGNGVREYRSHQGCTIDSQGEGR